MIRVVMADDQVILRESLKFIIEQDKAISVIGVAANGKEAFDLCERLKPDLVLMDIMMPEYNGIEGTRLIKEKYPQIKILILTTFDDSDNVSKALQKGADGYILKDVKPEELIMAVKNVYQGFAVMHKSALSKMVANQPATAQAAFLSKDVLPGMPAIHLTEREISIVRLIVEGKNNKEIASELFLSEGTVKNIITTILEKLALRDRTQLAIYAIKHKLV